MAFIVPNEAEKNLLNLITGKIANSPLKIHLFTSDVDPKETTVLADLTPPTITAYNPVLLEAAKWTVSVDAATGETTAKYATEVSFDFTEVVKIYGYYLTDSSNNFVAAERFENAPLNLPGKIAITPELRLD